MGKAKITKSLLTKLDYDFNHRMRKSTAVSAATANVQKLASPTIMIVFADSDLNSATYHLAKSMEAPFSEHAISTVLVQESARKEFIAKVQPKLPTYGIDVIQHPGFIHALKLIERMKVKVVNANGAPNHAATIVCDVTHEHFGSGVTGIVTMHTFRTAKEAIALYAREPLVYTNATIWHENHSSAYEIVATLRCRDYFINCDGIPLDPLEEAIASKDNYVAMENSYHYETITVNNVQKNIVFPIGTIFAN